jgi:hypothetical protein
VVKQSAGAAVVRRQFAEVDDPSPGRVVEVTQVSAESSSCRELVDPAELVRSAQPCRSSVPRMRDHRISRATYRRRWCQRRGPTGSGQRPRCPEAAIGLTLRTALPRVPHRDGAVPTGHGPTPCRRDRGGTGRRSRPDRTTSTDGPLAFRPRSTVVQRSVSLGPRSGKVGDVPPGPNTAGALVDVAARALRVDLRRGAAAPRCSDAIGHRHE